MLPNKNSNDYLQFGAFCFRYVYKESNSYLLKIYLKMIEYCNSTFSFKFNINASI